MMKLMPFVFLFFLFVETQAIEYKELFSINKDLHQAIDEVAGLIVERTSTTNTNAASALDKTIETRISGDIK